MTVRFPDVGSNKSPTRRKNVLLPQPEGPMSDTNSPGAIVTSAGFLSFGFGNKDTTHFVVVIATIISNQPDFRSG